MIKNSWIVSWVATSYIKIKKIHCHIDVNDISKFIYLALAKWHFRQNNIILEDWAHQIYDNAWDKWFITFTLYEFQYMLNISKRAPRQSLMKNHCYNIYIHIKLTDALSSSTWMSLAHHTRLFAYWSSNGWHRNTLTKHSHTLIGSCQKYNHNFAIMLSKKHNWTLEV